MGFTSSKLSRVQEIATYRLTWVSVHGRRGVVCPQPVTEECRLRTSDGLKNPSVEIETQQRSRNQVSSLLAHLSGRA